MFSKGEKSKTHTAYSPPYWDERLYRALFGNPTEADLKIGQNFTCLLVSRLAKLNVGEGSTPTHTLGGAYRLWLSEEEHCDIPVRLSFAAADDLVINQFSLGYLSFSWLSLQGRPRPSLDVVVRDKSGLQASVASLFVESKAVGASGLAMSWSLLPAELTGKNAEKIWGNWEAHVEYDEYGHRKFPAPIGRSALPLESLAFELRAGEL